MAAGLIDPRDQAELHAAVLALAGADRDTVNAVRRATRDVNKMAASMVARSASTIPPAVYGPVWQSFKIRPLYTRAAAGKDVSAGGIVASFIRGGYSLVRSYEFGSSSGDLRRGRTRPKRSPYAAGRRYQRTRNRRSEARIGMTQFPTRSKYGWYVGPAVDRHLDAILLPWVDAVAGVFDGQR